MYGLAVQEMFGFSLHRPAVQKLPRIHMDQRAMLSELRCVGKVYIYRVFVVVVFTDCRFDI